MCICICPDLHVHILYTEKNGAEISPALLPNLFQKINKLFQGNLFRTETDTVAGYQVIPDPMILPRKTALDSLPVQMAVHDCMNAVFLHQFRKRGILFPLQ